MVDTPEAMRRGKGAPEGEDGMAGEHAALGASARAEGESTLARRLRLIVITDAGRAGAHGIQRVVNQALDAGAPSVQLRMKEERARAILDAARPLRRSTRKGGALLFVNDRFDVALAAGADGVHLGPDDLPVSAVRRSAPRPFLIGYSADDPDEAREAVDRGADYIGCGTVYPTGSKEDAGGVIGLDGLEAVVRAVDVPVVAIGGITPQRAPDVARTGAAGVAVVSAVMGAEDPGAAVRGLLRPFTGAEAGGGEPGKR